MIFIDDGGRGRDTDGLLGAASTEAPQSAYKTGALGTLRAGEGVRLIKDEKVEAGVIKKLHIALARQE